MSARDEVVDDRVAALRALTPDRLVAFGADQPLIGAALLGRGPLAPLAPHARSGPTVGWGPSRRARRPHDRLEDLAEIVASPAALQLQLLALDRASLQVVQALRIAGEAQSVVEIAATIPHAPHPAVADTVDRLAAALLVHPVDGPDDPVRFRPGVAEAVPLPGRLVRDHLRAVGRDTLDRVLHRLGTPEPGVRELKIERLQAALRDREVVERALDAIDDEECRAVFTHLARQGVTRTAEVGVPWYWAGPGAPLTPLHVLGAYGLIGVDSVEQTAWVWLDVRIALDGTLFPSWAHAPEVRTGPVDDVPGLPGALGHVDALTELWRAEPAPARKDGVLGSRVTKAAAKRLGLPEADTHLLARLAVDCRLVGLVERWPEASASRRRTVAPELTYEPTAVVETWRATEVGRRWCHLVDAWLAVEVGADATGTAGVLDEAVRLLVLADLAALEPGTGVHPDDLPAWLAHRHALVCTPERIGAVVAGLRLLGLVPARGAVGLTTPGRAVLAGPEAIAAALPAPVTTFLVQPDHTVIAPPDLHPDVLGRLERLASVESHGGARVLRLSLDRVADAIAGGWPADAIVRFLRDASVVPLDPAIERFVADAAARTGGLAVHRAATVVTAPDPVALQRAAAVKAAQLTVVAPGVAVSPLPEAKVLSALRAKGLVPAASVLGRPEATRPLTVPTPAARLAELPGALVPTAAQLAAVLEVS